MVYQKINQHAKDSIANLPIHADTLNHNDSTKEDFVFLNEKDSLVQTDNLFNGALKPIKVPGGDGKEYLIPSAAAIICDIMDTAKVNEYLRIPEIKNSLPRDIKLLWTSKPDEDTPNQLKLVGIKSKIDGKAPLEGDAVTEARTDFGQNNQVEISMTMNTDGAAIWKRLTAEAANVKENEPKRSIAVVLDDYVYSYPTVENEIPNGRTSIHGNFTLNEANDLANVLKAGKLPAPARIVEEAVVGPSLGQQSINDGLRSFAFALVLILIYMVFYYNNSGWNANLALLINLFFLIGVLASFQAVLTLPGILGIVLTMGMAVDANVLINERIREELSLGKGLRTAIERGYDRAFSAIFDANVTHLITGTILVVFGSGPIQGFAIVLIIGVLTSFITSVFITRIIFLWLLDKKVNIKFSNKLTEGFLKNLNIKFVEQRRIFYGIFAAFIVAGAISFGIRDFNYGIDFSGGRSYVLGFKEKADEEEVKSALKVTFEDAPQVKVYGANNQLKITTNYLIEDKSEDADAKVEGALKAGLEPLGNSYTIESSQKVGPTVADDLKKAAFLSVFFALAAIFLYVALRFRNWRFGLGAVFALLHDVLFVLAAYTLLWGKVPFALEIDKELIAALLTVVGYSINDTVVVFDRIRENHPNYSQLGKSQLIPVINKAINDTMSRTVNTALTVIIVLGTTFIFGGDIVRGFTFSLLIGVISGTYSSIAIAIPTVIDFTKEKADQPAAVTQKKEYSTVS
jgi:SecD/SecF fusion protein